MTRGVSLASLAVLTGCTGTRIGDLPQPAYVLTHAEAHLTRIYAVDRNAQGWKSYGNTDKLVKMRLLDASELAEIATSFDAVLAQSGGRRCQTELDDSSLEVTFSRLDDQGQSSVGACRATDDSLKPPADALACSMYALITGVEPVQACATGSHPHLVGCGDGVANGTDLCDGWSWRPGVSSGCSEYGLGAGEVLCRADCKADFAFCERHDYCTQNELRTNGVCDPCSILTPTDPRNEPDPECAIACGADGVCADRWYPLVGDFACRAVGLADPDCACGNGALNEGTCAPPALEGCTELCDGSTQLVGSCADWGLGPGTLACEADCRPDFSGCTVPPSSGD